MWLKWHEALSSNPSPTPSKKFNGFEELIPQKTENSSMSLSIALPAKNNLKPFNLEQKGYHEKFSSVVFERQGDSNRREIHTFPSLLQSQGKTHI